MKLKYKKIILLTTMSTMGIGMLTLSISHDRTNAEDNLGNSQRIESVMSDKTTVVEDTDDNNASNLFAAADITAVPSVTPTPTVAPTPTPLPVYDLEEDGHPKIVKLIEEYYTAKKNRDADALKKLSSDPSDTYTQEELQQKTEYIDDYRNIKVYVKKSFTPGTFIVYAYSEIKFTSINTPAPGLAKFYVIRDDNGDIKICDPDSLDAETLAYYNERNSDPDVVNLIKMTDDKSAKAKKDDEDLLNFWNKIEEMAGQTPTPEPTKAATSEDKAN